MGRVVLSDSLGSGNKVRVLPPRRLGAGEEFVLHLVSVTRGVSRAALLQKSRGDSATAEARHLAMYLINVMLQRSLTEIGRLFGRDRTTIRHACARIEDMRDDRHHEEAIARLEAEIEIWRTVSDEKGKRRA